ncbi:phage tail sheath family protein [Escherichia coli P0304777.8]|nr:phage tail sheath family protein [Escherichia coli P0304777.8]
MSETRFHGARVTESTDLVTAINDVDSSVIGIVATADDADAELFPLNKPTLLTRVNDVLGKCGTTGTLYRALKAIADQVSTKVIVVRVAEHKEEDGKRRINWLSVVLMTAAIRGCMRCLLQSRMKASDTVRVFWPRRSWTRRR